MSSYCYLEDSEGELGFSPLPEDEIFKAYKSIAKRQGLNITDKMILEEIQGNKSKSEKKRL